MAVFQDVLINFLQVKQGYAWHYKYYEKDQTPLDRMLYSSAEIEAREKSRGLWSTPANAHNIAPSHWVIQSQSATRQVNSFPALMSAPLIGRHCQAPVSNGCYFRLSLVWVTLLFGLVHITIKGPQCAGSRS
jgi:hypothetical protein